MTNWHISETHGKYRLKVSTTDQVFNFEISDDKVGITLSGGIDSAVFLQTIAQFLSDTGQNHVSVIPFHGMENLRPDTVGSVQSICDYTHSHYPDLNLQDLVVFPVYSEIVYSKKKKGLDEQGKVPQMNAFYDLYELPEIIMAMNCLPEKHILDEWGCNYYSIDRLRRDRDVYEVFDNFRYYKPIVNCDKRMTKALFDYLELDDELLEMTSSCTGFPSETEYYTKPCGKCYHCQEKKWAFGKL